MHIRHTMHFVILYSYCLYHGLWSYQVQMQPRDCALNNTKAVKIKLILNTGCQKSTRGLLNVLMDQQSSYMMMGLSNFLY